jgi:hypothetical protein
MTNKIRNPNALSLGAAALIVAASLLTACGAEQKPAEPPPVEDTAFRDMAGAMDKARAVEGTMQQHKEDIDRVLEQKENPTAQ